MGQTSEEKGVGLVTSCSSNEIEMTVHLKKRGYKPTTHKWTLHCDYPSREEADKNPEKVMVVMDTE